MRTIFLLMLTLAATVVRAGEIIRLSRHDLGLLPKGKEVDGMPGDWLMRNDKVVAVIGSAAWDREANQMVSSVQGAVLDYSSLAANNDQLVVYYPQGARVDVRSADTIVVVSGRGSVVALKVIRYPTPAEPYRSETVYTLRDGETALRVETFYSNVADHPVRIGFSDKLRCDNDLEYVSPAGRGELAFIDNKWFHAAYGVGAQDRPLYTSGKVYRKNLILLGYFIRWADGDSVELEPGGRLNVKRFLLTGKDVADLQEQYERLGTAGQRLGGGGQGRLGSGDSLGFGGGARHQRLSIYVSDDRLRPLEGAFIRVTDAAGAMVSSAISGAGGRASAYVDSGEYRVTVTMPGHDTLTQQVQSMSTQAVAGGLGGGLRFTLAALTSIDVDVSGRDGRPLPAKVEFRGIDGTKDPYLGPPKRSAGANNIYYTRGGSFSVPIPPGVYQVVFSHGPEYEAIERRVVIGRGECRRLPVTLLRAFATPHYIIGDLHNHTTRSGDSNADVDGRIINMAAVGIEFAPATEHNRISDYTDEIRRLHMQHYIASAAGIELSGRPGPGDINHETAFPLRVRDSAYGYGAPHTDRNPYVQMKRLYDYDNGAFKLMQHNHPNIGWLYFDRNRDGVVDSGFGSAHITDVLEIREAMLDFPSVIAGKETRSRLLPWLQMLNLGYRIYGVANSDNHIVGPQTGSMFNYIYYPDDRPEAIDAARVAREVKRGHVVISNGPFLTVGVRPAAIPGDKPEALPGDELVARGGRVQLHITVHAANWCRINTVQVLINGRADSAYRWTVDSHPELFAGGPLNFDHSCGLTLAADAHVIVVAYGAGNTIGMVTGGKLAKNIPIAMSNPVYVDVDGNGFKPNGDLLGYPAPNGKVRVAAEAE